VVWGSAFVVQRLAVQTAGVFLFNGLRFCLGALVLLPLLRSRWKPTRPMLGWAGLAGLFMFGAGGLQQAGLRFTTAGNAAFLTGLYVVFVPLFLWVVWRRRLTWAAWVAVGLAAVGTLLLSAQGHLQLAPGDGLELAGAVLWALHVITVDRAMRTLPALPFAAWQFTVAGLLNLAVGAVFERGQLPGLVSLWWTVAYTGILSVGVGYTLQVVGQKYSPPTEAALILSLEAVFAALAGYWFLNELLAPIQLAGCGLILAAIGLAVWKGTG
jgi:drug/metabolite transporter (DMT)-like permease